jgi:hypothetical protein
MCELFFSFLLFSSLLFSTIMAMFPAGSVFFLTHFVDGHLLLFRTKQSVLDFDHHHDVDHYSSSSLEIN